MTDITNSFYLTGYLAKKPILKHGNKTDYLRLSLVNTNNQQQKQTFFLFAFGKMAQKLVSLNEHDVILVNFTTKEQKFTTWKTVLTVQDFYVLHPIDQQTELFTDSIKQPLQSINNTKTVIDCDSYLKARKQKKDRAVKQLILDTML